MRDQLEQDKFEEDLEVFVIEGLKALANGRFSSVDGQTRLGALQSLQQQVAIMRYPTQ